MIRNIIYAFIPIALIALIANLMLSNKDGNQNAQKDTEFVPLNFLDGLNKKIVVNKPAKRIATIATSAPLIYYAVKGDINAIISISKKSRNGILKIGGLYSQIHPQFDNIEANATVGNRFQPNVEQLLKLQPDFVIQWGYTQRIIKPMEAVGINVIAWSCCTEEDRYSYTKMSGYLSGNISQAQTILSLASQSKNNLIKKFKNTKNRLKILEMDQMKGNKIRVIANGSIAYENIALDNPAKDSSGQWWKTVNIEQIIKWNPDIIIIPGWKSAELKLEQIYNNSLLKNLKAVKNRAVYKEPLFTASPDAPEIFLQLEWLAQIAYPKKFHIDFRKRLKEIYQTIYHAQINDALIDDILNMQYNKSAKKYTKNFK